MRSIVFIDSHKSGSSKDAIIAAGSLGFYTILMTNRETFFEKRTEFPYVHEMIRANVDDIDEIRTKLELLKKQRKEIIAISSFIEPYVHTAALLGKEYGLRSQTPQAIATMLDKIRMRELLQDTGYVPFFRTYDDDSVVDRTLNRYMPIVVKAPMSTGSKDVMLATNRMELTEKVAQIKRRHPEQRVLLEQYLDGPQYLVEVLVHAATPHIVAVVEQSVSGRGRFIVMGYCVHPTVSTDLQKQIEDMVQVVVERTGMQTGALHIEFRVVEGQCIIIEVNPRMSGGAMNHMINVAFGINLAEQTLRSQMGKRPNLVRKRERYVFTQYLTVSQRGTLQKVTGKNQASHCEGVEEVYVKPRIGSFLKPPTSMGQRYAYVLSSADSQNDAERSARNAAKLIHFHLSPKTR